MKEGTLIIAAPSHQAVLLHLRELGIPPLPFMRQGIVVVTPTEPDRYMGVGPSPWTVVPEHEPGERIRTELAVNARQTRGTGERPWHEALLRLIVWRNWHEQ